MEIFIQYLAAILIGYSFGSIPSAYLLVNIFQNKDIRKEGSGIVGTMNAFEVSNSIPIGLTVLLLDIFKGVIPPIMMNMLYAGNYWTLFLTSVFCVLGHIFPIWLKFKGGRGLAVTAGIMLVIGWIFIVIWIILFVVFYIIKKHLHLSNIFATFLTPIILFIIPEFLLNYNIIKINNHYDFILLSFSISLILLFSHKDYLIIIFKKAE